MRRGGRCGQRSRSSRGPAGQGVSFGVRAFGAGRPGGRARKAESTRDTGRLRPQPPGGARGDGGKGRRPRQVRGPTDPPASAHARAPLSGHRPVVCRHQCAGREHAPLTGRRPNRSAQQLAPRPGATAPRATWPGEGSPVRDGACAVARARPSAGKEHAQCEDTIGYVGAQGMLGEGREPAHAQKRSEPATHWWREKRGEKSPQSYVRKGRVLWGGYGLPRGPAVLLGRGA